MTVYAEYKESIKLLQQWRDVGETTSGTELVFFAENLECLIMFQLEK